MVINKYLYLFTHLSYLKIIILFYPDVSLPRNKINSLLILLGQHGLKLNAVYLSYITDGVPMFIIHEV